MTTASKCLLLVLLMAAMILLPSLILAQAPVSDDTWTVPGGGNNGAAATLNVQDPDAITWIRFDLGDEWGTTIQSNMIQKATLKVFLAAVTKSGTFNVCRVTRSWSEATLTGSSTQPGTDCSYGYTGTVSTWSRSRSNTKNNYLTVDITNIVKDWLAGTHRNHGIALMPASEVSFSIVSKEGGSTETEVPNHDAQLDIVALGATGATGPPGPQGIQGPTGATGASIMLETNNTANSSQTVLNLVQGTGITVGNTSGGTVTISGCGPGGGGLSSGNSNGQQVEPATQPVNWYGSVVGACTPGASISACAETVTSSGTASNLSFSVTAAPGGANGTLGVTLLQNGNATALRCMIGPPPSDTAGQPASCSDTSDTVSLNAGDIVALQISSGGGFYTQESSTGSWTINVPSINTCLSGFEQTIASGNATLGTSAISSGACASVVTVSAAGVLPTDAIQWAFNAATGTGWPSLTVQAYPTGANVNFLVCNPSASSVTPAAATLNWRVAR